MVINLNHKKLFLHTFPLPSTIIFQMVLILLNSKEFQERKDSIQSSIIQFLLMELVRDTEEIHELYIQED